MVCGIIALVLLTVGVLLYLLKKYIRRAKYTKPTRIDGKVVIITGANTGIGKENAIDLAKRGGKVYIACRDEGRGTAALDEIKYESGSKNVHFMKLNLASLDSVREFSKSFHEKEDKLDILINNAGVMACPKMETEDGFEMQFGVNHLGHFLLTHLLLDLLKAAPSARIINVSSYAHTMSDIIRDDLMGDKKYDKWKAYGQSKIANILFSRELARKLKGTNVTVNSCHPGTVTTELSRHMNKYVMNFLVSPFFGPFFKTPIEGAQTQIRLAVDPDLENVTGKYFANCKLEKASKHAENDETAEWLYKKSIELVKLSWK